MKNKSIAKKPTKKRVPLTVQDELLKAAYVARKMAQRIKLEGGLDKNLKLTDKSLLIVKEIYRNLDLKENINSCHILKVDKECMLICKNLNLEVAHRWNNEPGSMQPGHKLIKRDYCIMFIFAWNKPTSRVILDLCRMGCPLIKVVTPWEVEKVFQDLNP